MKRIDPVTPFGVELVPFVPRCCHEIDEGRNSCRLQRSDITGKAGRSPSRGGKAGTVEPTLFDGAERDSVGLPSHHGADGEASLEHVEDGEVFDQIGRSDHTIEVAEGERLDDPVEELTTTDELAGAGVASVVGCQDDETTVVGNESGSTAPRPELRRDDIRAPSAMGRDAVPARFVELVRAHEDREYRQATVRSET